MTKTINFLYKFLLLISIFAFLGLFFAFILMQSRQDEVAKEQLKIQKETHILSLYSTYKSNIDGCKQEAIAQKKDEEFIQANCIEVINSSMLGKLLKEWGQEDLLIKQ